MMDAAPTGRAPARVRRRTLLLGGGALVIAGCAPAPSPATTVPPPADSPAPSGPPSPTPSPTPTADPWPSREQVAAEFAGRTPSAFGIVVPGVITHGRRDVVLTLDACGGSDLGNGFDADLIALLERHAVPATLFLNGRWIHANPSIAADLAAHPLFELANHGWEHRPLSVTGASAYGIAGTKNPAGVYDEIVRGVDALAEITGERSSFFRPGTAWCDDVAVEIATRLGVSIIAFDVNADAGATASKASVAAALGTVRDRSIAIGHFNRPEGATAEGVAQALPKLLDRGVRFAKLGDALA